MPKFVGKAQAEKIVLLYLTRNTQKPNKCNPALLTENSIAKNTNLSIEDVEEALKNLSEDSARVEKLSMDFEFWLPLTNKAETVKQSLIKDKLAVENILFYAFVSILILGFFLNKLVVKGWINLEGPWEYFTSGVIITAISIKVGKYFSHKYFILDDKLKRMPGYKYYIWCFIIFTSAIIWLYKYVNSETQTWQKLGFFISIIANVVTVLAFLIQYIRSLIKR